MCCCCTGKQEKLPLPGQFATIYSRLSVPPEKCAKQTLDDTKLPTAHTSFLYEHSFPASKHIRLV